MAERAMIRSSLQMIGLLIVFAAVGLIAGCSERIVYKQVRVAVPVLAEVPEWTLKRYEGRLPVATPEGEVCFSGDEIKTLQEYVQFYKVRVDAFQEVYK